MRVIKFRAWDNTPADIGGQVMLSWDKIRELSEHEILLDAILEREHESLIPMQFTGLTDANGVEIYEGDIVRWDDASKGKLWRVAQVVWHENGTWAYRIIPSSCVGCFKDGKGHDFKLGNFIYTPDSTAYGNILEVIGNIHQNPELLESNNV